MTTKMATHQRKIAVNEMPEGRAIWPYRILITIAAVTYTSQPITAGQFMSGSYGAAANHAAVAYLTATGTVALVLPAAIWAARRRVVARKHVAATVILAALAFAQIFLGEGRVLSLHVPLGVAIVMLAILQAWSAWKTRPGLVTGS